MSDISKRRLRLHALAVATTIALSSLTALPVLSAERVDLSGLQSDTSFDQFIVKYRDGSSQRTSATTLQSSLSKAALAVPAANGKALGLNRLRRLGGIQADVVRADRKLDRAEAESLMRQIAADPAVEYVEVDQLMRALFTPDDPRYSEQWGFTSSSGGIRAPEAWDLATGQGVVVAVIDSGIVAHPDLDANSLGGYDFVSSTSSGQAGSGDGDGRDSDPTDSSSVLHGTHVAGTIAAVTDNGVGVSGTAFDAKILVARVLGNQGYGSSSDIIDAITWTSGGTVSGVPTNANPAEVINLSLGGSGSCSTSYQNAINGAVGRGTTVVIAAGNSNTNVSNATPANCNNVVAIAANDQDGARSVWSSSQASNYGSLIDVAAPGTSILSTYRSGSTATYSSLSGTSMATPHVAGVAALIQSVAATPKTPAEVEDLLKQTARAFPSTPDQTIGSGIVDANAAVVAAQGGGGGNAAPTANFTSTASGLTVSFTDTSTDSDGSIASRSWNFGDSTTSTATNPSKTYSAAGTYTVSLTVTDDDGATNTKSSSVTVSSGSGSQTYTNTTDYTISDNSTVSSPITVSGRSGNAPSSTSVAVNIVHTYKGDLKVDLVAPDGSVYVLHNRTGGSTDNINTTYTVNLSSEALNGTWNLRVNDNANADTGYINSWSITF